MSYYFITSESKVTYIDDALYASWVSNGNPKASYYILISDPPSPNHIYNGTEWVEPTIYIPQQVSRFQILAALDNLGMLEQAQNISNDNSIPTINKLAWENALYFDRNSTTISVVANKLGLTDKQVDDLFVSAITYQA